MLFVRGHSFQVKYGDGIRCLKTMMHINLRCFTPGPVPVPVPLQASWRRCLSWSFDAVFAVKVGVRLSAATTTCFTMQRTLSSGRIYRFHHRRMHLCYRLSH